MNVFSAAGWPDFCRHKHHLKDNQQTSLGNREWMSARQYPEKDYNLIKDAKIQVINWNHRCLNQVLPPRFLPNFDNLVFR